MEKLKRIVSDFLESPDDPNLIATITENVNQIRTLLREDLIIELDSASDTLDVDSLTKLYDLLSGTELDFSNESSSWLVDFKEAEEEEVGNAFRDMVESLGKQSKYTDWSTYFEQIDLPKDYVNYLVNTRSVQASGETGIQLASEYGISPMSFSVAARKIQLWGNKATRSKHDYDLILSSERENYDDHSYDLVLSKLQGISDLPEEQSAGMLKWIVNILEVRKFFIPGYSAEIHGADGIKLNKIRVTGEQLPIYIAWCKAPNITDDSTSTLRSVANVARASKVY